MFLISLYKTHSVNIIKGNFVEAIIDTNIDKKIVITSVMFTFFSKLINKYGIVIDEIVLIKVTKLSKCVGSLFGRIKLYLNIHKKINNNRYNSKLKVTKFLGILLPSFIYKLHKKTKKDNGNNIIKQLLKVHKDVPCLIKKTIKYKNNVDNIKILLLFLYL